MIFEDFRKAVAQLGDAPFRKVLLLGLGWTLGLLIAACALVFWGVSGFIGEGIRIWGIGQITWFDNVAGWGAVGLVLFLSSFLMIPVAAAISSFFLEDVAEAVEAKHYPAVAIPPRLSLLQGISNSAAFLAMLIGLNIVALFVYLFVFWIPFAPLVLFWALNGYLLGREYFELAATRHLGLAGARNMRRAHRGEVWMAGALMAMPLSIPLVNLLIPVLGAATFTHLFHRLRG